jgi:hypothetical protein
MYSAQLVKLVFNLFEPGDGQNNLSFGLHLTSPLTLL